MRMNGVDWRPFRNEFRNLFGAGAIVSHWVGEGWFEILWSLCASLEKLAQTEITEGRPPLRLVQVKEKYGSLRVYVDGGSDEAMELIDAAETASETICEVCGKPGNIQCIRGWDKCLCPPMRGNPGVLKISESISSPIPRIGVQIHGMCSHSKLQTARAILGFICRTS